MSPSEPSTVVVPPGHELRVMRLLDAPHVLRLRCGALIAQLGCATDDPGASAAVVAKVREALQQPASPVQCVAGPVSLSALFENAVAKPETLKRMVVWTAARGGLAAALEGDSPLSAWWQSHDPATQVIFVEEAWVARETVQRLQRWGLDVRTPERGGELLAEVLRPDGSAIIGLLGAPARGTDEPGAEQVLTRAPRWTRLCRACIPPATPEARRNLFDEMLSRRDSLLFFVGSGGHVPTRDFGDGRGTLVAYGDLEAMERAASELGLPPANHGVGALTPRALLGFAAQNGLRVGIAVYPEQGQVQHLVIDGPELAALASGRLPDPLGKP